jgi:hypothetical protein
VTATQPTSPSGPGNGTDAELWNEAKRLRAEHPGWIVLWLADLRQYRAYPLVHARRGTALTAPTPHELAAQINQACKSSHTPPGSSTT